MNLFENAPVKFERLDDGEDEFAVFEELGDCPNPLWLGVPPIMGGNGECTPIPALGDLELMLLFLSVAVTLLLWLIPPSPLIPRFNEFASFLLVLLDKEGDGEGKSLYCP